MMVPDTPDTVVPVVDQCEANGRALRLHGTCPWQTYIGNNFTTGYKWSLSHLLGG